MYDSLHGGVSAETRNKVKCLAGRGRIVYCTSCTQQTLPGDCGPFALAYATTVVLGGDPATYELDAANVREHLSSMVRDNKVSMFPVMKHCYCNNAAKGSMVACDACDRWFHRSCLSAGHRITKQGSWLCHDCIKV